MASMFGKDAQQFSMYNNGPSPEQKMDYFNPGPPVYSQTTAVLHEENNVREVEPVDCAPAMLYHPMAALRWFQLLMFFVLQWLVQITCGNDACTMIMNVFGYIAMGQLFVLLILLFMSIMVVLILIGYGLNGHRAFSGVMLAVERFYAIFGIILFLIAGILGTWMAVQTNDELVNYQGRGSGHIRPQWIAAAVIEFLMFFLYIFDFLLQRREGYPFTGKNDKREATPDSQYTYGQQTMY